jgi:hypothetical protein
MPFLAKHVQLRQVKTSHAEVLAQDAESEQQRRGTVGVCRLSMKILGTLKKASAAAFQGTGSDPL